MPHPQQHKSINTEQAKYSKIQILKEICTYNFNIITLINFFISITYYIIFITSTAYAREVFSLSLSTAGLTAGIIVIGCLVGRFITGNLLSFVTCRITLFCGLTIYLVSIAYFFLTDSVTELFLQRFASGIGIGIISTTTSTIIANIIPPKNHGFGISIYSMSIALALALGPFLGILLISNMPYIALIKINFAIVLGCMLIFFCLKNLPVISRRKRPIFELNSYIDPRVVLFSLVALLLCLAYGCVQAFMTSYAAERNLSEPAGIFFLVYALTTLATRPLTGLLYDKRGENIIFIPIFILMMIALCLLAVAATSFELLLAGVILGFSFGNFASVAQAVSLKLVTRSRFAQATTTLFIFFDLGIGIGPYFFGFLIPEFGYKGMYLALAVSVFCAMTVYYLVHGRHISARK